MSDSLSSLYGGRGISIASGRGGRIWDSEGREYVDFFNGHGASLFGHGNQVLRRAVYEAADGVWSSGAGFESPVREELARLLGSLIGGGMAFICNSGAEAIEAALKLSVSLRPGRHRILACRRGFHGRTCGALALTFNPKYRNPFKRLIPEVEHFEPDALAQSIDEDTIAVFVEPVQGEGGVYPLSPKTGAAISESCRESGALLISDEIQTGLGRCGAVLASPSAGLDPDIICLAKGLAGGLPIGAAVWKSTLGDFPSHGHGSTYGGGEFIARVAAAALKLILEGDLSRRAGEIGEELRSGIEGLGARAIKEIRGMGMLNGIEITSPSVDAVKALQRKGLLSLAAGPRVVRFLPSFAASPEDISLAVQIIGDVLTRESGAR
ncbi:MAG: aminotransferase class III-fold pyridoxal phosphate-dependent enzyme [Synergistaceae bacterium]|jgi:acetylornithine/LysW-gamma-L-lysine aminotransferase|nr:aminotransferase class III-fold pyridoxal phosphate-dependent enzyme [Synergistaceae bacterium]